MYRKQKTENRYQVSGIRYYLLLLILVMSMTTLFSAQAPSFVIETMTGERIRSETLLEKGPIFLEFWNIGCRPCLLFLPHVSEFVGKYPEMTFVAVNTDGPRHVNNATSRVRSSRWAFITALDGTRDLQRLFNVTSNPHTIIINQAGEIVYNGTGFNAGDEAKFEEIIVNILQAGKDEE